MAKATDQLAKRVHQFRYVISAQQAQWVRDHYRKKGWTDAQALAAYIKYMDEANTYFESIGIDDADYYYDYNYGESSRLHNKVAVVQSLMGGTRVVYPDNSNQVNFKLVMSFHSEFIIDESGHFLNEIDPEGTSQNAILNGASFNYANKNNKGHAKLDILPIRLQDPSFRRTFSDSLNLKYKIPNKIYRANLATRRLKWEDSYFNPKGNYAKDGKSAAERIKNSIKAFKSLVKEQKNATKSSKK